MDPKQELAASITTHVMRILSMQEQIRDCDKKIDDLRDQQSRAEQERHDLENQITELTDVLQYSLMNSSDPTQALLTMTHKEVKNAVSKTNKKNQSLAKQLSYLQEMLDPNYTSQADWIAKYTSMKTW